ncbi:MAG: DHH family phosphoesterase, partial [Promethearchaeota archaeon]
LSGNPQRCAEFLKKNKIEISNELNELRTMQNLSNEEKISLNKGIIFYALKELGYSTEFIKDLTTTNYLITDPNIKDYISDGKEFASILNACGRYDDPSIGIAAVLGNQEAIKQAIAIMNNYKRELGRSLNSAKEKIRPYSNINTFYDTSINQKIIGTICSILVHSPAFEDKPLFAFADSDHHSLKVSSRAPGTLVKKGLDLGKILRETCKELEIEDPAGGHPPAAGGKIPSSKLKDFIEKVNEKIGKILQFD